MDQVIVIEVANAEVGRDSQKNMANAHQEHREEETEKGKKTFIFHFVDKTMVLSTRGTPDHQEMIVTEEALQTGSLVVTDEVAVMTVEVAVVVTKEVMADVEVTAEADVAVVVTAGIDSLRTKKRPQRCSTSS